MSRNLEKTLTFFEVSVFFACNVSGALARCSCQSQDDMTASMGMLGRGGVE